MSVPPAPNWKGCCPSAAPVVSVPSVALGSEVPPVLSELLLLVVLVDAFGGVASVLSPSAVASVGCPPGPGLGPEGKVLIAGAGGRRALAAASSSARARSASLVEVVRARAGSLPC